MSEGVSDAYIEVPALTAARREEIARMKADLASLQKTKRCFQSLPHYQRRRVQSHNPRRVPRTARKLDSFVTSPPAQKQQSSRAARRSTKALLRDFNARALKAKWLPSHLFTVKRAHVSTYYVCAKAPAQTENDKFALPQCVYASLNCRDVLERSTSARFREAFEQTEAFARISCGFKLPVCPTQKCRRFQARMLTKGAAAADLSHFAVVTFDAELAEKQGLSLPRGFGRVPVWLSHAECVNDGQRAVWVVHPLLLGAALERLESLEVKCAVQHFPGLALFGPKALHFLREALLLGASSAASTVLVREASPASTNAQLLEPKFSACKRFALQNVGRYFVVDCEELQVRTGPFHPPRNKKYDGTDLPQKTLDAFAYGATPLPSFARGSALAFEESEVLFSEARRSRRRKDCVAEVAKIRAQREEPAPIATRAVNSEHRATRCSLLMWFSELGGVPAVRVLLDSAVSCKVLFQLIVRFGAALLGVEDLARLHTSVGASFFPDHFVSPSVAAQENFQFSRHPREQKLRRKAAQFFDARLRAAFCRLQPTQHVFLRVPEGVKLHLRLHSLLFRAPRAATADVEELPADGQLDAEPLGFLVDALFSLVHGQFVALGFVAHASEPKRTVLYRDEATRKVYLLRCRASAT